MMQFSSPLLEIVITEHDKPRAKIVPVAAVAGIRTAGLYKGKIKTSGDFDVPLPDSFWMGKERGIIGSGGGSTR